MRSSNVYVTVASKHEKPEADTNTKIHVKSLPKRKIKIYIGVKRQKNAPVLPSHTAASALVTSKLVIIRKKNRPLSSKPDG